MGYEALWLVGEDGKPLREIRRQPDGNWLVHPKALGVAPDGSAAVVATDSFRGGAARLNVYAADGSPVTTIRLGATGSAVSVAFDGKAAVVSLGNDLLLVDAAKGSVAKLAPLTAGGGDAGNGRHYWHVLFSLGGRELWALDAQRKAPSIERYEHPIPQ